MKRLLVFAGIACIVMLLVSAPPADAQRDHSCKGLENAFSQLKPDSPARDQLIRQMGAAGCDADGDGVINVLDICPGQNDHVDVDGDGTPDCVDPLIDSDGDGVADSSDVCPGQNDTIDVDGDGTPDCVDPLIDSDGDGVADSSDVCPGQNDTIDVDGDGTPDCVDPLIDSDGDGVADSSDVCPGEDDTIDVDDDGIPDCIDPTVDEYGSLQVTKVVEWGSTPVDESQAFEICITGPTYPELNCVELGDGQSATWLELGPGEYTVTETDPGIDWQVSGSGQVVVVAAGQTASATVTNTRIPDPEPGSLKVTKVVEWGVTTPDTNQRFRICITGPTYPSSSCISSDYDGVVVTWLLLEPGDYTVTEIDPGADWQVSGSGQVVVVAAGQSASATITNTRIP